MNIPGFPGGLDFAEMMKQAQEMQEKMQREMDQIRVDASVGGGMVTVLMSGTKDLLEVKVDPEMLKNADVEMLQDMIVAAVNEAGRKVDEKLKGQLGAMMPPGMGL
ncbi:MAG: YbaB/EbfC family nucleoid-associated protein [Blastocatellia bacterium]|nr:YbaB/EbfC family nucleoid-associated protein [Blastocatellia bacterium]MBK6425260.1 YbaB/EbfC family nucleoid-associated protein [Blastocatellia bacterium]